MVRARCRKLAAGEPPGSTNERKRLKLAVERIDLAFQPRHLRIAHLQSAARILGLVGEAKIGAEIEQIVLDAREHGIERGHAVAGMQAGEADGGVGLVERAIALDPEIVFRHAPARAERGRAVVAGARVNLAENDHPHRQARAGSTLEVQRLA